MFSSGLPETTPSLIQPQRFLLLNVPYLEVPWVGTFKRVLLMTFPCPMELSHIFTMPNSGNELSFADLLLTLSYKDAFSKILLLECSEKQISISIVHMSPYFRVHMLSMPSNSLCGPV